MKVQDQWVYSRGERAGQRKPCWGQGMRYRVRYQNTAGGWSDKYFPNGHKPKAEDFAAKKRTDANEGIIVDDKAGKATIEEYGKSWLKIKGVRDSSYQRLEIAWRLQIIPHLGHIRIGQARPSQIKGWVKTLKESGYAPATIHLAYGTLANMFNDAVADRAGISITPCRGIKLPPIERGEYWLPTEAQVAQLIEAIDPRYALAVYLAAGCGLRWGEMAGMTVGDIDFLRRKVYVRQALRRPPGEAPCFGKLKSVKSRRDVDLPAHVGAVASAHIAAGYTLDVALVDKLARVRANKPEPVREATLLFSRPDGDRMLRPQEWSAVWHAATSQVKGMPETFTFHGLRHYFASLLIHGGKNIIQVQKAMGHAKSSTTSEVYGHLFPTEDDGGMRSVIDNAFARGEKADAAQTG